MLLDIKEIREYLPHRYPFLLVDRVVELEVEKRVKAIKNVTCNEDFFNGHFPDHPVMPGVLIIEALAQAAGVLGFKTMDKKPSEGSIYLFVGADDVRFKRQVVPGDQLIRRLRSPVQRQSRPGFRTRLIPVIPYVPVEGCSVPMYLS